MQAKQAKESPFFIGQQKSGTCVWPISTQSCRSLHSLQSVKLSGNQPSSILDFILHCTHKRHQKLTIRTAGKHERSSMITYVLNVLEVEKLINIHEVETSTRYRLLKSDKNFGKENLGITKDI